MHADGAKTEDPQQDTAQPLARRLTIGTGGLLALALVVWASAHVMIPPVHPERPAPAGHYGAPCWVCHIVTRSAPLSEGG